MILDRSIRQGLPLPDRIKNAPELLPGLAYYYKAFQRLTTSRMISQGCIGAIPYAAISTFCLDEGLLDDEREDMFYHVEHLDAVYMDWQNKKLKQDTPPAPQAPRPKRR